MPDESRDARAIRLDGAHHRIQARDEVDQRRGAGLAVAVADVVEEDDLVSRFQQWHGECAQLRAASAPAMCQHDRRPIDAAEAPRGDAPARRAHLERRPGREELALASGMREARRRGEEPRCHLDGSLRREA
jgi:hypothetical protein